MRAGWLLTAFVLAALLAASAARADDPPALARAKAALEAQLEHFYEEDVRVVWPDDVAKVPPEGAEIVVIGGYRDNSVVRLVWREGRVESRRLDPDGEDGWFAAAEFDVPPGEFATLWNSALLLGGARPERAVPSEKPVTVKPRGRRGCYETRAFVRLACVGATAPLHWSDPICHHEAAGTFPDWGEVVAESVYDVIASRLPQAQAWRAGSLTDWRSFADEELRRALVRGRDADRHEFELSLESALTPASSATSPRSTRSQRSKPPD
jgi:hypothetical protein